MNVTSFENPWAAVKSTSKLLNSQKKIYSERPRNKYEPAHSMWWLVPSPEWPCYRFGKFVFMEKSGHLNCGIHVEKGFGEIVIPCSPNASKHGYIWDDSWMWNTFMRGLESGEVSAAINEIEKNIRQPVTISIHASPNGDAGKWDPYGADRGFYSIKFNLLDDKLVLQDDSESGPLSLLEKADDLRNIPSLLGSINSKGLNLDWFWIDFYIYVRLNIVNQPDSTLSDSHFDATRIYRQILEPFHKWCASGIKYD